MQNIVLKGTIMKKILFSFLALSLISSFSLPALADCSCSKAKTLPECACDKKCDENLSPQCSSDKFLNKCDKCSDLDDDEYYSYNQCFLDKQFKKLKKELCLTKNQECNLDNLYKNFKNDIENYHIKYRTEKNKLLEMINCGNDCYKEQAQTVKDIKKDIKERCKTFKKNVKSYLCKDQYSDLRRFCRHEKKKMKKIVKYGAIYKLPCNNCCTK